MKRILLFSLICLLLIAADTYPPPETVAPYPAPATPIPATMTKPTDAPTETWVGCAPDCELDDPTGIELEDFRAHGEIAAVVLTIALTAAFVIGVFFMVGGKEE